MKGSLLAFLLLMSCVKPGNYRIEHKSATNFQPIIHSDGKVGVTSGGKFFTLSDGTEIEVNSKTFISHNVGDSIKITKGEFFSIIIDSLRRTK